MDILTGSISGKIHLFRRRPNGAYAAGETLKSGFRDLNMGQGSTVCTADWNGNGKLDLVVGNQDGAVYLVSNEGTRQKPLWGNPVRLMAGDQTISAWTAAAPYMADWDGDGKLDLLLGSWSGEVVWYRNVGTATEPILAAPVTLVKAVASDPNDDSTAAANPKRSGLSSKICVTDWNGDGRPDLVVGDYVHGWVWVYLRQVSTAQAGN